MSKLTNDRGMTLAELLVVLALSSILMIILTGIILSIQDRYSDQSTEAGNLYNVTYASKVITKEARMAQHLEVATDHVSFTINNDTEYSFVQSENALYRNGSPFASNVTEFHVDLIEDDYGNQKFLFRINSSSGKGVDTEIILRGSD